MQFNQAKIYVVPAWLGILADPNHIYRQQCILWS